MLGIEKLEEKKKSIVEKIRQLEGNLQMTDQARTQIIGDIVKFRGKLEQLEELIAEEVKENNAG